ncbi:MAG TPA: hypothetical protein VGQ57_06430 [Polyangiaceae bacterium]|jgi:hypothetical protein|nr:hypothetical protein [Polyangiaceae bacterium]
MTLTTHFAPAFAFALAATALQGCTLQKDDASTEFQEALPEQGSVSVDGPAAVADMGTQSGTFGTRATGGPKDPAFWYGFTRDVRDGVNVVTAVVLASVWAVVHTEPAEADEDHAVFGPYDGDALDPARYRLTVTRIGDHHFRYVLDGQKKSGGDFLTVLDGDGYSLASESHGDGQFVLDLGNAKMLDPSRHEDDSGKVTVVHDLPRDIGRRKDALPRTITASVVPDGGASFSVTSVAREDHTGELDVTAHADIDDSHATALEDVAVVSRWRSTGAGRADVGISGGDLPAQGLESVTAVECWGTDFSRVYYADSAGIEPTVGDPSECVYDTP